jgi:hypothetical protein
MIEDGGAILFALARMAATAVTTLVVVGSVAGYDRLAAVVVSDEKASMRKHRWESIDEKASLRIHYRPQHVCKGEKRMAVDEAANETGAWQNGHPALDAWT